MIETIGYEITNGIFLLHCFFLALFQLLNKSDDRQKKMNVDDSDNNLKSQDEDQFAADEK